MKKNEIVFTMFLAVAFTACVSAITIFETFDTDATTGGGNWTFLRSNEGSDGNIVYHESGAMRANFRRSNLRTCRLYYDLGTSFSNIPEYWLEYDIRFDYTVATNGGYVNNTVIGLFSGDKFNSDASLTNYGMNLQIDQGKFDSSYDTGGTVNNPTAIAGPTSTTGAWNIAGTVNYRVKSQVYYSGTDVMVKNDIYTLGGVDGNTETLLSDFAAFKVGDTTVTFGTALDSVGFGNRGGTTQSSNFHLFEIDNFYFSTEGSNLNTVAPFAVPEPITIAMLGLGSFFIRKRK